MPKSRSTVKERAFKAYEAEGNSFAPPTWRSDIARNYGYAGKHSIASAWSRRAERIIGPTATPTPTATWRWSRSEDAAGEGRHRPALALAERAIEIGEARCGRGPEGLRADEPGLAQDRLGSDVTTGWR